MYKMNKKSRTNRTHVTPGVYFKEIEVPYASKSMGITTLGLAGETLKGPAFQPISIENWKEFQTYFGGTSTEKFRGSKYPKYELPYIAQEYLKQSNQLEVVRTLGLSGVNAGPAWVITATKYTTKNGYVYEQSFDEDENVISLTKDEVYSKINPQSKSILINELGCYNDLCFKTPNGIPSSSYNENTTPDTVYVLDGNIIDNYKVVRFDDLGEENFTKLPEGLVKEFGTYAELKNSFASIGGFLTFEVGDNKEEELTDGNIIIELNISSLNINDKRNKILLNYNFNLSGEYSTNSHNQSDYYSFDLVKRYTVTNENGVVESTYNYVIIPLNEIFEKVKTVIEEELRFSINDEYCETAIRNLSDFRIYQYGYTLNDSQGEAKRGVNGTGLFYKYEISESVVKFSVEDEYTNYNNVVIAVLRSRGEHKKSIQNGFDECGNPIYTCDGIEYYAKNVTLKPTSTLELGDDCLPGYNTVTGDFNIDTLNYGKFDIVVDYNEGCQLCGIPTTYQNKYSVSLNPEDKNYIIKVLGTNPEIGQSEVYVEELYDVALQQMIYANEINAINSELICYPVVNIIPDFEPVEDFITKPNPTKKEVGKRYLYTYNESKLYNNAEGIKVRITTDKGITWTETIGSVGHIYTVIKWTNKNTNKVEYFYGEYRNSDGTLITEGPQKNEFLTFYNYHDDVEFNDNILGNCVKNLADESYYVLVDFNLNDGANEGDVVPITLDFNNYKEAYRYASTPWFVSELKGDGENINLHKLFRFHTISDGASANTEVKVSIENIDTENETFDVLIREFYDTDLNPNILERYNKCSLKPSESNYLGLKIGTYDNAYVSQSTYVTVEINEDDETAMSIPCGFLGFPVRNYHGFGIYNMNDKDESLSSLVKAPYFKYNTTIDDEINIKKQYFGMSDLIGIDEDVLSYKGYEAYNEDPDYLTPCFHLDARILNGKPVNMENGAYYLEDADYNKQIVSVDGVTGYNWVTVSKHETLDDNSIEPRIGIDAVMENTIYEDKKARKFTTCFYGGWDGWDYYRTSRSNSDDFRYNKYKGCMSKQSGQGTMFSVLKNAEEYGFTSKEKIINSDYYAYLAAIKQLDNPKTVSLNLLATPGIDYVNQTSLTHDVINMIEEDRGDVLYILTTPDKPFGAGDSKSEMYTPEDVVYNLENSDIDTNYACTYYPWEKYWDESNNQYIYLPVTRDVVRNMAYTDNVAFPWYATAGWNRGNISGVEPKRKLKLNEQDTLYEGRINFINSFAKEGDRIWGDKNLQYHDGIMNRISKRRLVIRLKTLLQNACVGLLFDPNDATMVDTFKSSVKTVLDPILKNRGITDYKVEVDDSAEARDRLELPAVIHIKPTQMLEYITIDLAITPQGVDFQ